MDRGDRGLKLVGASRLARQRLLDQRDALGDLCAVPQRAVPLAEQDRSRWDRAKIAEGVALVEESLASKPGGPYQLQAAIAAIHDEASSARETDLPQIVADYEVLERFSPGPMVTLNRAVAVAMVDGPRAGLELLKKLDEPLRDHHRLAAVRAHLLEMAGDEVGARAAYERAARLTTSIPERRYLEARMAAL